MNESEKSCTILALSIFLQIFSKGDTWSGDRHSTRICCACHLCLPWPRGLFLSQDAPAQPQECIGLLHGKRRPTLRTEIKTQTQFSDFEIIWFLIISYLCHVLYGKVLYAVLTLWRGFPTDFHIFWSFSLIFIDFRWVAWKCIFSELSVFCCSPVSLGPT